MTPYLLSIACMIGMVVTKKNTTKLGYAFLLLIQLLVIVGWL